MRVPILLVLFSLNVALCKVLTQRSPLINSASLTSARVNKLKRGQIARNVEVVANVQRSDESALKPSTARALLVSCAALYGSNYPLTKLLQDNLNPSFVTTIRFMIASVFFLPSTIRGLRGDLALSTGSIELGVWCSVGFISQAMILTKTSASKAAFFCGLSVIMPPIFALAENVLIRLNLISSGDTKTAEHAVAASIEQERQPRSIFYKLSKSPFIKPFLALCGAAILEWGSGMEPAKLSDLSLLVTPVSFAMCFWRSAQLGAKYPTEIASITGIMLSTVAVVGFGWSSVSMNFCCSAVGGSDFPAECSKLFSALRTWKVIGGLLYSGIFTTAFTSYVEQQVIRVLTAAETTLIYTLEPLFATACAAFFLGEHVTRGTLMGAVFIILACLWDTIIDFLTASS